MLLHWRNRTCVQYHLLQINWHKAIFLSDYQSSIVISKKRTWRTKYCSGCRPKWRIRRRKRRAVRRAVMAPFVKEKSVIIKFPEFSVGWNPGCHEKFSSSTHLFHAAFLASFILEPNLKLARWKSAFIYFRMINF